MADTRFQPFWGKAARARDPLARQRRHWERQISQKLYAYWRGLQRELLKWLAATRVELLQQQQAAPAKQVSLEPGIDWAAEEGRLQVSLADLLHEAWDDTTKLTAGMLTDMHIGVDWALFNQATVELAERWSFPKIKDLTDSTREQLGKEIGAWTRSSEAFPDLVARIRGLVPQSPTPGKQDRAQLIAATEVTAIFAQSRLTGFAAAGLQGNRWRTGEDEIVCAICRPLGDADDGEGALGAVSTGLYLNPADGQYYSMPAHPGCRCWAVADMAELEARGGEEAPAAPAAP